MSRDRDCGVAFYSGGNWNNGANGGSVRLERQQSPLELELEPRLPLRSTK